MTNNRKNETDLAIANKSTKKNKFKFNDFIYKLKLFFRRKTKAFFILFRIGNVFKFLSKPLKLVAYLFDFSYWANKQKNVEFNDFLTLKFIPNARYELYKFLIEKEHLNSEPINYLEFGVASGYSFRWWLNNINHSDSRFYGFDTFEGLPENWGLYKKGDMTPDTIPQFSDPRAVLIKGLFQDTLFDFLRSFPNDRRKVINMDADLYSSTIFVLTTLAPFLRKGDIIIFDEFGSPLHEFRAFMDFANSFYIEYQTLGAVNNFLQIAVMIK